jgi:hypothetical protein
MLTSFVDGRQRYGDDYYISGKDGVHPGLAGQIVMAHAFLKGMGLDGDIGTFTVDLGADKATASAGHEVVGFANGELKLNSSRYPFCAQGSLNEDNSIRSGMTLVPFNQELNRFMLVAKGGSAAKYKVTWGSASKTYTADELAKGVNLAADFAVNPFTAAFEKVDAAVAAKQEYETRQIKMLFHGPEGHADPDMTATLTEEARAPLAAAIARSHPAVEHTIRIAAE